MSVANDSSTGLNALRRFAQKRSSLERCELCGEAIPAEHRHLLDLSNRGLVCACQACSLLFHERGAGNGKYALIPRRYLSLANFQMSNQQWDELMIPVNMAFLFSSSTTQRVMVFYPGPAGATESLLALEGWETLALQNPVLKDLEPDVEALLINRVRDAREYYIVPIDACYQLVGLIRRSWRGLGGGTEVWQAVKNFFADIYTRSGGKPDA